MNDSENISNFLNFVRCSKSEFLQCHDIQKELEIKTQDVLHTIEIKPLSATQMVKAYKTLREVRKQRRVIKDKVIILTPLIKWATENQEALKLLEQTLGDIRKQERYLRERQYSFKTDICKEFGVNENSIS